jgi:predicted phage baseplate assembly protein
VGAPLPAIARRAATAPRRADEVSYLARDYEGLRQLMLDRLAVTLPAFTERHIPDIWMTLVELLAYAGDDLSYYEDAVATEAYLQTARQRISIRRHARLLGYRVHDGCSARAWVAFSVSSSVGVPLGQIRFAAAGAIADGRPVIDAVPDPPAWLGSLEQFTPLPTDLSAGQTQAVRPGHNSITPWGWGESDCSLAIGATSTVLEDGKPSARALALAPGDVLVLEETQRPEPPLEPAAPVVPGPPDPTHRQAVRLTGVRELTDPLYDQPLLEVRWGHEDALSFELPVRVAGEPASQALGNVVLVSHGAVLSEPAVPQDDGAVTLGQPGLSFSTQFPDPQLVGRHQARLLSSLYAQWRASIERLRRAAAAGTRLSRRERDELRAQLGEDELARLVLDVKGGNAEDDARGLAELLADADRLLARRRVRLETLGELARSSGPLDPALIDELREDWGSALTAALAPSTPGGWGSAASAIAQDPRAALPVAVLRADASSWTASLDLIGVPPDARAFVAEADDEGYSHLRFGDPPPPLSTLQVTYSVGNGAVGNVVAEAINSIVWIGDASGGADLRRAVTAVRNPLPASGGVDAEDPTEARLAIPGWFEDRQPRALSSDDYAELAATLPGVRRAAAELRFTGSLTVTDVAVQPVLGEDPHSALLGSVQEALADVRRVGHVVRVHPPRYRPLLIALDVTLAPNAIRASVADEFATLLGSGWMSDGSPALFNPQRLAFGQSVFASAVIAAAQRIDGVVSVLLERFSFVGDPRWIPSGDSPPAALHVGGMEIVRLDNDPADPARGYAVVSLEGGR